MMNMKQRITELLAVYENKQTYIDDYTFSCLTPL